MKVNQALLKNILSKTKDSDEVIRLLDKYNKIEESIGQARMSDLSAKAEYDKKINLNQESRLAVRRTCDHPIYTYYGDPAGGHDSYHECDVCGHEF